MTAPRFSPGDKAVWTFKPHTSHEPLPVYKAHSGQVVTIIEVFDCSVCTIEAADGWREEAFDEELSEPPPDPRDSLIAEMREALRPFAKAGELFGPRVSEDYDQLVYGPAAGPEYNLTGDDLRRARSILAKAEKHGAGE